MKNLQRFDWYLDNDGEPAKADFGDITRSLIVDYKPIEITNEIMEANGFKSSHLDDWWMTPCWTSKNLPSELNDFRFTKADKESNSVSFDSDTDGWNFYTVVKISYVHQLQQFLRLVGLTELAENFKLKADN